MLLSMRKRNPHNHHADQPFWSGRMIDNEDATKQYVPVLVTWIMLAVRNAAAEDESDDRQPA